MRELSLREAVVLFADMAATIHHETEKALEDAARKVEAEAKSLIGSYQQAAGPFQEWAPLAETTLEGWHGHPGKVALGYSPPDNPLLRTGALRDSIEHQVEHGFWLESGEAVVGSDSDIAVWQELGTSRMPPRSFLGIAAVHKSDEVAEMLGEATVVGLVGESVFRRRIPIST